MKKLTAVFMSLLLIFSLASCSTTDSGNNDTPATDLTPSSQEPTNNKTDTDRSPDDSDSESSDSSAPTDESSSKTLIVYYSATGSTKRVAEYIASAVNGDIFELIPVNGYSDDDLDYCDGDSRVAYEHDHPEARDVELEKSIAVNWDDYDTVFIGYPLWWGIAAWPVNNFIKNNDFSGKTVIPFCTSASSGFGESGKLLEEMTDTGNWLEGQRFALGASEETVRSWVEDLDLVQ